MSVTKRKQKNKKNFYVAEVYFNGKRYKSKSFTNKAEACIWEENIKSKVNASFGKAKNPYRKCTFSDCLEKFFAERVPLLKRATRENYKHYSQYVVGSPIFNIKMSEFSAYAVDLWLEWLLKHRSSKNPQRNSFVKELKFLFAVLNWWRNYVDADFMVPIVKRHREKCHYKPLIARRPDYFARPEEIRAWIEELKKQTNPTYWKLAQFMVLTGVRVGEACGLMWSEVDFNKSYIRIVRTVGWSRRKKKPYLQESTKTEASTRIVMLPKVLLDSLKESKKFSQSEFVFAAKSGGPLKYNAIQSSFNKAFRTLDLPWRSTHICRHSFATMALMATRDLSAVQASLGHRDQKVTQQYAKIVALLNSETAEKTAEFLKLTNLQESK